MAINSHEMKWLRNYGSFGVTESGKSVVIGGTKYSDAGNAKKALTSK